MIDIAMLVHNRARITETCVRELKRRTTTPHRLLVLDNGSPDETVKLLYQLKKEELIDVLLLSPVNDGVHQGFNQLLEFVETPLYVCTDNDLVPQAPTPDSDWLGLLLALAERYPGYAAISLLPHYLVGDSLARWLDGADEVIERAWCGAALRLMRADAVRQAGGWQKASRPSRNHEERWICKRLKADGWKVGYSRDVRAIHLWGEEGEDPWGYPEGSEHGHREVWPPVDRYNWHRVGVDWETCSPAHGAG